MIITAFLNLLYFVITLIIFPITLLGDVSFPEGFSSAIATASSYLSSLNDILPIDTMLTIFGISLSIELFYLTYKSIMWVIKKIPTIN